jgi:ATP-dependent exoDNAse (exonuclease V) beta subunit
MVDGARDAALVDAGARHAVDTDLHRTIFLEAGAGSGKTSCLVDRFVALVEDGVAADSIAAITFTEKAAGELVDRIRARLDTRARDGSARCRAALDVIDRAAIGTLHSFAQRVLTEHPIEAGLPPRITVLDEIASQVAFEARWEAFRDELLDDPGLARPLRLLLASSATLDDLHDVAAAFDDNWDLVEERRGRATPPAVPELRVDDLVARLDVVVARADECRVDGDRLLDHLRGTVAGIAQQLRDAIDDDTRFALLHEKAFKRAGDKRNWGCDPAEIRDELSAIDAEFERRRTALQEGVLQVLATRLAEFTIAGAETRRRAGELEFHDLLVLSRAVVRDPERGPDVRRELAARYQRLLLDEFQDTDPIQVELAVLIASDDPDAASHHWSEVDTEPGRLFFVGDPKQSIYRFRRADIAVFLEARDGLVGDSETLTTNFRAREPIVRWVNHAFSSLIQEAEGSQPKYVALDAVRPAPEVGPPVMLIGTEHDSSINADGLRDAEARDVVLSICRAIEEKWTIGDDARRAPRWRDVAILVPARTSLPFLERALEAAEVPYRVETSSLVYGTREVRDLIQIARAVDDPTDELAVVAALRTPGFGVGDDDLFTWRRVHRGRWDHQGRVPDDAPADHPVASGLRWLGQLHRERRWLAPSAVLERIVRDRRLLELAVEERRPRDLWRRLRFVLDQCRAWEEAGGDTLRHYLLWVEGQSAEGARVVETVLPESDDDAVRILTVHGAKGLEFPITVLSGMTTEMRGRSRGVEVRFPRAGTDAWAIKLRKGVSTAEFEASQPIEDQMDHDERLRLLYVAATRARDHLVVSVHRKTRNGSRKTSAEVLWDAGSDAAGVEFFTSDPGSDAPMPHAPRSVPSEREVLLVPLPTLAEWEASHDAALALATRPIATSATRLAEEAASAKGDPGLDKGPRDLDLPPWQKGRYGTAIGRAVHGVLQVVDLVTGDGLHETCASQAAAEGVLGKEDVIERLARAALDSPLVKRAATRPLWREVYVGVPWGDDGDGVLEGYVDLLYRDDEGLVVVDYKTDAWGTEADLDAKVERYAVQLRAYASALTIAVGEPIVRTVLLFLGESAAVERDVVVPPATDFVS